MLLKFDIPMKFNFSYYYFNYAFFFISSILILVLSMTKLKKNIKVHFVMEILWKTKSNILFFNILAYV